MTNWTNVVSNSQRKKKNAFRSICFDLSVAFVIHFAILQLLPMAKGERVGHYGNKRVASASALRFEGGTERVAVLQNGSPGQISRKY